MSAHGRPSRLKLDIQFASGTLLGLIRTSIDNQEVVHGRRQHDEEGHTAHREESPDTEQTSEDPAPSETAEAVDGVQDEMAQARGKTRTCAFFISALRTRGPVESISRLLFLKLSCHLRLGRPRRTARVCVV